jgi:hypothetical protein
VKNIDNDEIFEDQCDVLVSASGALNEWKWPTIPGLHDFKGKLIHSANWDESYDYSVSCSDHPYYPYTNHLDRVKGLLSSGTDPVESRSSLGCCQR